MFPCCLPSGSKYQVLILIRTQKGFVHYICSSKKPVVDGNCNAIYQQSPAQGSIGASYYTTSTSPKFEFGKFFSIGSCPGAVATIIY